MTPRQIRAWMLARAEDYRDECGEIQCTALVEAWDRECASGGDTLDSNHIAWDVAVNVATELQGQ